MKKYLLVALCAILVGGATSYLVVKKVLASENGGTYVYSEETPQVRNVQFSGE